MVSRNGTMAAALATGVAAVVLAGCGSTGGTATAAPSQPSHRATTTSSSAAKPDESELAGWIAQFCGQAQEDGEQYVTNLDAAFEATASQTTVADLVPTQQTLYSVVGSGIDGSLTAAQQQLQAASPKPGDAAARTTLLGVYQRLTAGLGTAEQQIQALPTTDVARFATAATAAGQVAEDAVTAAKTAISGDRTLGPVYAANPQCR